MGVIYAPAQYRQLKINGQPLAKSHMNNVSSITFNDVTDGQDTLEVKVLNKNQLYFRVKAFKRGMAVSFVGGMVGMNPIELFRGKISRISAQGGSSGQTITLHCTTVDTMKRQFKEPSMTVYKDVDPIDLINLLCLEVELGVEIYASADNVEAARKIRKSWYPYRFQTAMQRAKSIANEILGCNFAVKSIPTITHTDGYRLPKAQPRVVISDPPSAPSNAKKSPVLVVTYGKDLKSYSFKEKSVERPPEAVSTGHVSIDPRYLKFYETEEGRKEEAESYADELISQLEESVDTDEHEEVMNDFREALVKNYTELMPSGNKAVAERKIKTVASRTSEREMTGTLARSSRELVLASNWITVAGVGPYSGKYFVRKGSSTFGMDGCSQSLDISTRRETKSKDKSSSGYGYSGDIDIDKFWTKYMEDENGDPSYESWGKDEGKPDEGGEEK